MQQWNPSAACRPRCQSAVWFNMHRTCTWFFHYRGSGPAFLCCRAAKPDSMHAHVKSSKPWTFSWRFYRPPGWNYISYRQILWLLFLRVCGFPPAAGSADSAGRNRFHQTMCRTGPDPCGSLYGRIESEKRIVPDRGKTNDKKKGWYCVYIRNWQRLYLYKRRNLRRKQTDQSIFSCPHRSQIFPECRCRTGRRSEKGRTWPGRYFPDCIHGLWSCQHSICGQKCNRNQLPRKRCTSSLPGRSHDPRYRRSG